METAVLLPCSQVSATCPYPDPDESSPHFIKTMSTILFCFWGYINDILVQTLYLQY